MSPYVYFGYSLQKYNNRLVVNCNSCCDWLICDGDLSFYSAWQFECDESNEVRRSGLVTFAGQLLLRQGHQLEPNNQQWLRQFLVQTHQDSNMRHYELVTWLQTNGSHSPTSVKAFLVKHSRYFYFPFSYIITTNIFFQRTYQFRQEETYKKR